MDRPMNCSPIAPLALLAATALSFGSLSYRPDASRELATAFESSVQLQISEMSRGVSIDGEEHPMPEIPKPEFKMTESETIHYTDVVEMDGDTPSRITRRFTEIGNEMLQEIVDPAGEEHETSMAGESELAGATVQFAYDEDADEYMSSFGDESEDLDEDLLDGLIARADFVAFLPTEDVSEGDEWEVPTAAYISITHLCGDLTITREDDEDDGGEEYNEMFEENLESDLRATWKETVEEDGARYAVVAIEGELSTSVETEDEASFNDVPGTETTVDNYEFELHGTLRWNLSGMHASTLDLSGTLQMNREMVQAFDMNGKELLISEDTTFEGVLTYSVTVD